MSKQQDNQLSTQSILVALLFSIISLSAWAEAQYTGVNLAGAEFGTGESGFENIPGTYGTDYIYPTHDEIDYFTSKGMNIFRLPFRWERLQIDTNGSLDPAELARISNFVDYATSKQAHIILDPHNSARYYDASQIIGVDGSNGAVPVAAFQDFWTKLAVEFKNNNHVIFGLMNEPHDMSSELWRDDANAAISAIRATGATNLILVPGNAWSGAHSWNDDSYGTPNSTVMQNIIDPGNNYAFEVHQYLDSDSSGTSSTCVSSTIGSERLQAFTDWLHQHEQRGFLGEFAGGRNADCYSALDNMLDFVDANNDVWLGWTYWAAGPWWGEDIYTLEPEAGGADRPQMTILQEHIGGGLPSTATLLSPSNNITDSTPTYSWNTVSNSSWYRLWVNDSTGNRINKWYTAEAVGCASGTGICSITPSISLANGEGAWWVQTWNSSGSGPWSSANIFNLDNSSGGLPATAILLNPEGNIDENTTTFSWEASTRSTWYHLWVNDSTGNVINQWYSAAQTGCADGTGECFISPATFFANGSAIWWVQTWNSSGYGFWSNPLSFIVN